MDQCYRIFRNEIITALKRRQDRSASRTKKQERETQYKEITFQFLPSSSYAYTVGRNILDLKKDRLF